MRFVGIGGFRVWGREAFAFWVCCRRVRASRVRALLCVGCSGVARVAWVPVGWGLAWVGAGGHLGFLRDLVGRLGLGVLGELVETSARGVGCWAAGSGGRLVSRCCSCSARRGWRGGASSVWRVTKSINQKRILKGVLKLIVCGATGLARHWMSQF